MTQLNFNSSHAPIGAYEADCHCEICTLIKTYKNALDFESKIKENLKQQIKDYIYKHKHHAMYYDDEGSLGAQSLLDYLELL